MCVCVCGGGGTVWRGSLGGLLLLYMCITVTVPLNISPTNIFEPRSDFTQGTSPLSDRISDVRFLVVFYS